MPFGLGLGSMLYRAQASHGRLHEEVTNVRGKPGDRSDLYRIDQIIYMNIANSLTSLTNR